MSERAIRIIVVSVIITLMKKISIEKTPVIVSGGQDPGFAERVAGHLGMQVTDAGIVHFASGEEKVHIQDSVRDADVFLFQTHINPADALVEQLIMTDALRRASARRVTAVMPFAAYGRQDRIGHGGREPITSSLMYRLLAESGTDHFVTMDMHSGQGQGYVTSPFDHLVAMPRIEKYISKLKGDKMLVSPDAGRAKLTERYAGRLALDMAIVHKLRNGTNQAKAEKIIGEVEGRHCILNDDMIDTGGTIVSAAELLKDHGATEVTVVATHGLFSDPARERLAGSAIDRIAVTDTLPLPADMPESLRVDVIPVTKLFATAIKAIYYGNSVSKIFDGENYH